jgi:multiple sugar transport system permease protein
MRRVSVPYHYRATVRVAPKLLRHLLAAAAATLFMAPFLWTVLSSLKGPTEIYLFPPRWLPQQPRWSNYAAVWQQVPFATFVANTAVVTTVGVFGEAVSAVLVAYGFARFRFPGREALFMLVIATLILPGEVTIIPRFIMFRLLGWLDTFLPLTVPAYFGTGAFSIFLLRQFILSLPAELDEAAELDGAGTLRTLTTVLVPLMKPALATLVILAFLGHWNDFMGPLIYLRSTNKFTLALGLRFFQNVAETGSEPKDAYLMAASLMATAPCVALFFAAQRYFVQGVVMSGLKQ